MWLILGLFEIILVIYKLGLKLGSVGKLAYSWEDWF